MHSEVIFETENTFPHRFIIESLHKPMARQVRH